MKLMEIRFYADENGNEPFTQWQTGLRDVVGRKRILARLRRVEDGNYGDVKNLGDNIYELRLDFGPGYRIYFGEDKNTIIILLCGGDKSTQPQDIEKAKIYWKRYLENAKAENT
jgi:putative addiction module killer protein